jgi:hypothetical protein
LAEKVVVKLGDIDDAIMEGVNSNKELRRLIRDFIDETKDTWRIVWEASEGETLMAQMPGHPYQTGDYIAHIKEEKRSLGQRLFPKWAKGDPIPVGIVYNDSEVAHWLEYGTGPDKPGGHSPWGPDTPTPDFKPMHRTKAIMEHKDARGDEWE